MYSLEQGKEAGGQREGGGERRSRFRILMAHGWMHSAARYERLKRDLEETGLYEVVLYEFPGFGETPARYRSNILSRYVEDMKRFLKTGDFDAAMGHSMGGYVVLRAACEEGTGIPLVLMSPVYGGLGFLKPFVIIYPLVVLGIRFLRLPVRGTAFLIRLFSLFTINRWEAVDRRIIEDARRADPQVAARTLFEMAFDRWTVADSGRGQDGRKTVADGRGLAGGQAMAVDRRWNGRQAAADGWIRAGRQAAANGHDDEQTVAGGRIRASRQNWAGRQTGYRIQGKKPDRKAYRATNCPTTLILGEKDRVISRKKMDRLKKELTECVYFILPKTGHTAIVEEYYEFVKVIAQIVSYY